MKRMTQGTVIEYRIHDNGVVDPGWWSITATWVDPDTGPERPQLEATVKGKLMAELCAASMAEVSEYPPAVFVR